MTVPRSPCWNQMLSVTRVAGTSFTCQFTRMRGSGTFGTGE